MKTNHNTEQKITAFGHTVKLVWQKIDIVAPDNKRSICEEKHFYLHITDVAKYLVLPDQDTIIIEKENEDVSFEIISTWLFGTVFAYLLQYHGHLVLHGSAVVIDNKAVIFSGQSGAGKSTLAAALVKRGYTLITDDVVVIDKNSLNRMIMIPGPAKVKLWEDALFKLDHSKDGLKQIIFKENKYEMPIVNHSISKVYDGESTLNYTHNPDLDINHSSFLTDHAVEIAGFYELNNAKEVKEINCVELDGMDKLNTLIKNTYRYYMLKHLKKGKTHLQYCSHLAEQIACYKITRPQDGYLLTELVDKVLSNSHIT